MRLVTKTSISFKMYPNVSTCRISSMEMSDRSGGSGGSLHSYPGELGDILGGCLYARAVTRSNTWGSARETKLNLLLLDSFGLGELNPRL